MTTLKLIIPYNLQNDIDFLKNEIVELKKSFQPKEPPTYLTRNEVAELLKIDLSTLHNWTKKGRLKSYGIGGRIYYKQKEIENSFTEIRN